MRLSPHSAQASLKGDVGDTACVALKILCRSRRTLSSWARQSAAAQSSRSSSGPFTLAVLLATWAVNPPIASNLSFGSGAFDSKPQWLTWSTSAPFRARHVPVSGQFCEAAAEGSSLVPRFPVAFRPTGIRLSDHPFPPQELGLPYGRLTGHRPDPDGVSTFRTAEIRPARVPSLPRGHGAPTSGWRSSAAVAGSQRQALPPALRPISGGYHHEASTKVSLALTRPVFPLPVAPVWGGRPWAFPLMLRTPPLPATHVRVGTDHEHFSEAHCRLHARSSHQ